jgi:hypothetical protein
MADVSILDQAVHAAPKQYKVTGSQDIVIRSVTASFDGTGAASSFVPVVQIIDPSGFVAGTYPLGSTLTAGASADVSWFPSVGGTTSGIPLSAMMMARVNAVGNQTIVEGDPGTIVTWGEASIDTGSPTAFWTVAHPTRLTAPVAGVYLLITNLNWATFPNIADIYYGCYLYKNGADIFTEQFTYEFNGPAIDPSAPSDTFGSGSHQIWQLSAGDYFEILAYNHNGNLTAVDLIDARPASQHYSSWTMILLSGAVGPTGPAGGGLSTVEDGSTTLTSVNTLNFTSNATVSSGGAGIADVAISASGSGGLLAVKDYTGGAGSYSIVSATLVDVDAANLAVTFMAPASRNVLVKLWAATANATHTNYFFGVREGASIVGGPIFAGDNTSAGAVQIGDQIAYTPVYISGISAGAHTYKFAASTNAGTLNIRQGGHIVIEVWAAP